MASLAILVSLILLFVLIVGPITYILAKINAIPNIVIYLLSILSIGSGLWFFFLPIPAVRYLGLVSVLLGVCSINARRK